MATIPELSLFRWDCVDQLGDLERFAAGARRHPR